MDSVGPTFTGTPAVGVATGAQGPVFPAQSGLFGSGGEFNMAQTLKTTSTLATGFGGYASYSAGTFAKTQFDMTAKSHETRAEIVKVNATQKSNYLRKQLLLDLSASTASAGARGLDVGSGTPIQIGEESIGNVERDVAKLKRGGEIQAAGERTSASRTRSAGSAAQAVQYLRTAGGLGKYALSQVL